MRTNQASGPLGGAEEGDRLATSGGPLVSREEVEGSGLVLAGGVDVGAAADEVADAGEVGVARGVVEGGVAVLVAGAESPSHHLERDVRLLQDQSHPLHVPVPGELQVGPFFERKHREAHFKAFPPRLQSGSWDLRAPLMLHLVGREDVSTCADLSGRENLARAFPPEIAGNLVSKCSFISNGDET